MNAMLFVYGTLRPDAACAMGHEARVRLQRESQLLGAARARGTLVDLGDYPALTTGNNSVVGALVQLRDPLATLIWLDEYEGVTGALTDQYVRVRQPVIPEIDRPVQSCMQAWVQAWVYVLKHRATAAPAIASGNWLKRS